MNCEQVRRQVMRHIRDVPDFPKPGILFKDITPLLASPTVFGDALTCIASHYQEAELVTVVSPEARGFILGSVLAHELGIGFAPARKPGKLPYHVQTLRYSLEYGEDEIELHKDAVAPSDRVLVCDDLIATGGTAEATCRLVESLGGIVVGACFLVELEDLGGREKLHDYEVFSLVTF